MKLTPGSIYMALIHAVEPKNNGGIFVIMGLLLLQ